MKWRYQINVFSQTEAFTWTILLYHLSESGQTHFIESWQCKLLNSFSKCKEINSDTHNLELQLLCLLENKIYKLIGFETLHVATCGELQVSKHIAIATRYLPREPIQQFHLIGLYTLFMELSFVIILVFMRWEGAGSFLTTEHTKLNLGYSIFLNMSNYRSCNEENTGNPSGKNNKEWIHYLQEKQTSKSNEKCNIKLLFSLRPSRTHLMFIRCLCSKRNSQAQVWSSHQCTLFLPASLLTMESFGDVGRAP